MLEEKRVKNLILDDGSNAIIDLADAPRSIEVSWIDGLVTFREGFGDGRINGWVLTPDAVQDFSVDRINGRDAIRLTHKRCEVLTKHLVGYVQNIRTAKIWVDSVNAVYKERMENRQKVSEGRETNFRDYPVINDILEKKVNIVLPGAYQYSWGKLPSKKLSKWEEKFVERCMDLLARETSISRSSLNVRVLDFMPHDYDWLSDRVFYDYDSFEDRITQPLELIFDRQHRHDKIGVNNFSFVISFALVYFKDSDFKKQIGGEHRGKITSTFREFLSLFQSIATTKNVILCAPYNQSVYYTFYDAHKQGLFNLYQYFHRRHDIESLAVWLWQHTNNGIVACDLGEVKPLIEAIGRQQGQQFKGLLEYVEVPYERPIPVGFCFRKDDEIWARIQEQSLKGC